ncbi:MAG: tRNA (N6-threonylcarbamoyladenosine(37)-N6)-methyltransferase TrmO [Clostridia bacterium]|nr:tRNA (N6-threonylcarbamoyladenosine(37)-N6)-methyltransferase TrmO [Clostridia bacterium]
MAEKFELSVIGYVENDFNEKFGIPRQSEILSKMQSKIVLEKEYSDKNAFRGIEEFSHLWIIWQFSENVNKPWTPCVRPPRLGGNKKVGVFATRSPFRPNSLGMSSVELDKVTFDEFGRAVLSVRGADMLSGTPVFDIKPYVAFSDSHEDAKCSFSDEFADYCLEVVFPQELLELIPAEKRETVKMILSSDPRPSYQKDEREYGMSFGGFEIKFTVKEKTLTVVSVEKE